MVQAYPWGEPALPADVDEVGAEVEVGVEAEAEAEAEHLRRGARMERPGAVPTPPHGRRLPTLP